MCEINYDDGDDDDDDACFQNPKLVCGNQREAYSIMANNRIVKGVLAINLFLILLGLSYKVCCNILPKVFALGLFICDISPLYTKSF